MRDWRCGAEFELDAVFGICAVVEEAEADCTVSLLGVAVDRVAFAVVEAVVRLAGAPAESVELCERAVVPSDWALRILFLLCTATPARVASIGEATILIADATNIAQRHENADGLYPNNRGMLIEVR